MRQLFQARRLCVKSIGKCSKNRNYPASAMNSPATRKSPLDEEDRLHWRMRAAHLGGEMGSSQTVLPFKLAASDESLTAHGGLALPVSYTHLRAHETRHDLVC